MQQIEEIISQPIYQNYPLYKAALTYLDYGLSIIPVNTKKQPIIPYKEYYERKATKEEVQAWFEKYQNLQLGLLTGAISGISVIDIDIRNGGSNEQYKDIITPTVQTGSGGWHYYFKYEKGIGSKPNVFPGIDIKSDKGFVVIPPSRSVKGRYEWIRSIFDTPLVPLPGHILKIYDEETYQNVLSVFNPQIVQGANEGNRNNSAAQYIGHLLTRHPEEEWETVVWETIRDWNRLHNTPPLEETELRKTFNSITSAERLKRQTNILIPPKAALDTKMAESAFSPLSFEQVLSQTPDELENSWIIKHLIKPGWLVVLGGHGKQGKSTLAMHLLQYIRKGKSFVYETQALPVVYINCEMGKNDIRDLIKDTLSDEADTPTGESANLIHYPKLPLNLDCLRQFLKDQAKAGLCVIDSFRGAFLLEGENENQAGSVGIILRSLQNICRETQWTILLIHHLRKDSSGTAHDLSGSSEWLSAPDAVFTWECVKFGSEPGTLRVTGRLEPVGPLSITLSRNTIEFLGTSKEYDESQQKDRIIQYLSEHDSVSNQQIARELNLNESNVRRYLAELFKTNEIRCVGKGIKGDPKLWMLASDVAI